MVSKIALVTGGAGFVGSHLCDYLLAQGRRVICVDNLETGAARNVEHNLGRDFAFVRHDVIEPLDLGGEVDVVYHLATSPGQHRWDPLEVVKVAVYGTHTMLEFANAKGARFLLASSSDVYGDPQVHPQLSTAAVREYLRKSADPRIKHVPSLFPTAGSQNRFGAVLICEKEGFDDMLKAEGIPERYDLALMSTKGISARAARDLIRSLNVRAFTLHDMDKNGFVMAAGFPFATDIGIRMADVAEWGLEPEEQHHRNPWSTKRNLHKNGAALEEAEFVSEGQRVELNMLTSSQFVEFVETRLKEHGVEKVVPDEDTLQVAWQRAHLAIKLNALIDEIQEKNEGIPPMPGDLETQLRERLEEEDDRAWDDIVAEIARDLADGTA